MPGLPAPIENMILRYVKSKELSELLGVEWPGGSAVEESEDDWKESGKKATPKSQDKHGLTGLLQPNG